MSQFRVGLVGAGYIAETHAEVLRRQAGIELAAVADPALAKAEALAAAYGIPEAVADPGALAGKVDAVHVLVPPNLHRRVAEPLLRAGIHVLVEKPMAETPEDCAALQAAAAAGGAALHVNQNFPYHPAHTRLKAALKANRIGPVRHVSLLYNMPLRQLDAGQLGHWMFAEPRNLLLEQAVHPLSQIDDLLGPIEAIDAQPQPPVSAGEGTDLITAWLVSLRCARGTAQMHFALGQTFPVWRLSVIGDDGSMEADMIHNRLAVETPSRWLDAADSLAGGLQRAGGLIAGSIGGALAYMGSVSGLTGRSDPFYRSMQGSIAAFYKCLGAGKRPRGEMGARLVGLCCDAARRVNGPVAMPAVARPGEGETYDIALLGGTGFIGRHTLKALRAQGLRVAVFARSTANLPPPYRAPEVGVFQGSIADRTAVRDVVRRAPVIVNLAHGGGGATDAAIEEAMVGGARLVAEEALAAGCRHLLFVSSIAALYLGGGGAPVSADTPPDPDPDSRAAYARAKVLAEQAMLAMHRDAGLPVTILRPGVVLGQGTSPFHSGIGLYNRQAHCVGWNRGRNPLPLVLGSDVASAIVAAAASPATIGKSLNLVGDVRLSAAEYTAELAKATGRPLAYHPQPPWLLQAEELAKWAVKRLSGRAVKPPGYNDLKSRGMAASFDCAAEKALLGWRPEADRQRFLADAFAGLAAGPSAPAGEAARAG